MSTIKVANVHFESAGSNRIDYLNDNILRVTGSGNIAFSTANTERMRIDGSGNVSFTSVPTITTANIVSSGTVSMSSSFLRNRIINGDMRIDQRNAGGSVNLNNAGVYTLDRWQEFGSGGATSRATIQQNAGAVTPPAGFTNYLGVTSSGAYAIPVGEYYVIYQKIEGYNVSDLGWGAAGAQSVTLSFWVRSSLTGTFGGSIQNSAQNRNYNFAYTISSANTWEYKTVTIPGDTTGTWLTTTGIGIHVFFSVGSGSSAVGTAGSWGSTGLFGVTGQTNLVATNAATWYLSGVQLEAGTVATPFERRLYSQELALCQRYCVVLDTLGGESSSGSGLWYAPTAAIHQIRLPVEMRVAPSLTNVGVTVTMYISSGALTTTNPTLNSQSRQGVEFYSIVGSGSTTAGWGCSTRVTAGKILLTAEL